LTESNGIFIAFGIACGALLSAYQAKKIQLDPEIIYYLFLPLTFWGFIGARLWHIFTPPLSSVELGLTTQHYLTNPLDVLAVWIGGFGIAGALIGATLALLFFSYKYEQSFWQLADILTSGILLAQIIGRFTNYLNQELYGLPTNLPWAIFIDPTHRLIGYEKTEFYHPLFAYEILLNTIILIWLLKISKNYGTQTSMLTNKSGNIFLIYLASYSLIRFCLEFLRLDVALVNSGNVNQIFFIVLFLIASILWFQKRPFT
jgi:phosphatidylglycerol---prolipoprotein diacylglyceryl transferase